MSSSNPKKSPRAAQPIRANSRVPHAHRALPPGKDALKQNTDNDLAVRLRDNHCEVASCELYRRLLPLLLAWCRNWVRRWRLDPDWRQGAEDLAHDAFAAMLRGVARFDESQSLRAWLWRIAHNLAVDRARRLKGRREVQIDRSNLEALGCRHVGSGEAIRAEESQALAAALIGLPKRLRAPLVLRVAAGKPYRQIADELNLPQGTVATLVSRARKALSRSLPKITADDLDAEWIVGQLQQFRSREHSTS